VTGTPRGIGLRTAVPADIDAILEVEHRPEYAAYIMQWSRDRYDELLADPAHRVIVAEGTDGFAGYVILSGIGSPSVQLERIAIREQGRGHGRAVLQELFDLVYGELGASTLGLDVVDTNLRARRLYESVGFEDVGRVEPFHLNGRDVALVLMTHRRD
jgi:diamine N-acetyltransferase